jgi:hypothetical protein
MKENQKAQKDNLTIRMQNLAERFGRLIQLDKIYHFVERISDKVCRWLDSFFKKIN